MGRVAGFRGKGGEVTVRVASGHAERWVGLGSVLLSRDPRGPEEAARRARVRSARAYRDRLVLGLQGITDAGAAAALKGLWVLAPAAEVPPLPDGEYYVERLVGLAVLDEEGTRLGTVADLLETGGADVLVLDAVGGGEILIPFARSVVLRVSEPEGFLVVRLPEEVGGRGAGSEGERR